MTALIASFSFENAAQNVKFCALFIYFDLIL